MTEQSYWRIDIILLHGYFKYNNITYIGIPLHTNLVRATLCWGERILSIVCHYFHLFIIILFFLQKAAATSKRCMVNIYLKYQFYNIWYIGSYSQFLTKNMSKSTRYVIRTIQCSRFITFLISISMVKWFCQKKFSHDVITQINGIKMFWLP